MKMIERVYCEKGCIVKVIERVYCEDDRKGVL